MTCYGCHQEIRPRQKVNHHHTTYRSQGGKETEPMHRRCHVQLHMTRNDFVIWGRIGGQVSAIDGHWSFYLNHVKDNPRYDATRAQWIKQFSQSGLSPVLALDERSLSDEGWQTPFEKLTLAHVKVHPQVLRAFRRVTITIGDTTVLLKGNGRKITSR